MFEPKEMRCPICDCLNGTAQTKSELNEYSKVVMERICEYLTELEAKSGGGV